MIDVRRLRADPEGVLAALARRGDDLADIQRAVELDRRERDLTTQRDEIRNRVKAVSREVGQLRKAGDVAAAEALQAESRALGDHERELDGEAAVASDELRATNALKKVLLLTAALVAAVLVWVMVTLPPQRVRSAVK